MKTPLVLALVVSSLLPTSAGCQSSQTRPVVWSVEMLAEKTPLEFLESICADGEGPRRVTIKTPVRGWILESDIPALIRVLDSPIRCRSVVRLESSYLTGWSKMGDEAAFLIEGFRNGFYPSELHSRTFSRAEVSEIKAWWARYQLSQKVESRRQ